MASKEQWLVVAVDSLESASALSERERWRSAVSRSYYAAHAAAHALVVHFEPARGDAPRSIRHVDLPPTLRGCLRRLPNSLPLARLAHDELVEAYNLRIVADYKPGLPIDSPAYDQARKAAARMIYSAKKVIT